MDEPLVGMAKELRRPGMSELRRRLIRFARHPIAGKAKTRLIPAFGAKDPGTAWLFARIQLDEAEALINHASATGNDSNEPQRER